MSYLVLARKYRPADFSAVRGQEHVTRTLQNAIRRDKVVHAFLFAGPRGVGKTSIARIFAKALNCEKGPTAEPCCSCSNCREIAQGSNMAVREIDGASHNSVDNVRELIESFRSLPAPGSKYKIYIIDEVHMLSMAAFNALLKSLEEPPPHTVFILATTEAHKIPETVISRCQRHDLRALSAAEVEQSLATIAASEKLDVEQEVFRMIARLSEGSLRDAQSMLDRVQSFCDGRITAAETSLVLGAVERRVLLAMVRAVLAHDPAAALAEARTAFSVGLNPSIFLREFVTIWRELLLAKFGGHAALSEIGVAKDAAEELLELTKDISGPDVQDLVQLAREGADAALRSAYPRYAVEAVLVRMASREQVVDLGAVLRSLKAKLQSKDSAAVKKSAAVFREEVGPSLAPQPQAAAAPLNRPENERTTAKFNGQEGSLRAATAIAEAPVVAEQQGRLDWRALVEFKGGQGRDIFLEHLKRFSVTEFAPGILRIRGPEFSVGYFKRNTTRGKLLNILSEFTGIQEWELDITVGDGSEGGLEPGSLTFEDHAAKKAFRKKKTDDFSNHPAVRKVCDLFPGSRIEHIKIKE